MSTPDVVATLQDTVVTAWSVGAVSRAQLLQRTGDRLTVALETDLGPIVAQSSPRSGALGLVDPSPNDIDRRLGLLDHLAATAPDLAPTLVRTRGGARFVITADDRCVYVLRHVPGRPAPDTPDTWSALGRLAAAAHVLPDTGVPFGIPWDAALVELRTLALAFPFADAFLAAIGALGSSPAGPSGLIHGELNPANAVLRHGGTLTVVDWDQAGHGPVALDLGYPLLTAFVTTRQTVRHPSAVAFYGTWAAHTHLPPADRPAPAAIVTAALFHAARYLRFADTPARWSRLLYALTHRDDLERRVAHWLA